ncbi:hypothetical protein [Psittacicella hinzii]|uniref:Uncharacterized protein n=1 Tax=Psittacicella hinzii TaxID=2028575 RepID=A0A3A1YN15_9GAMM|nr:hypothetical protein [Psittacicella hinzii]RIY38628.1 hypothetical protein CKF58_03750 [Psittacicella hinzii]
MQRDSLDNETYGATSLFSSSWQELLKFDPRASHLPIKIVCLPTYAPLGAQVSTLLSAGCTSTSVQQKHQANSLLSKNLTTQGIKSTTELYLFAEQEVLAQTSAYLDCYFQGQALAAQRSNSHQLTTHQEQQNKQELREQQVTSTLIPELTSASTSKEIPNLTQARAVSEECEVYYYVQLEQLRLHRESSFREVFAVTSLAMQAASKAILMLWTYSEIQQQNLRQYLLALTTASTSTSTLTEQSTSQPLIIFTHEPDLIALIELIGSYVEEGNDDLSNHNSQADDGGCVTLHNANISNSASNTEVVEANGDEDSNLASEGSLLGKQAGINGINSTSGTNEQFKQWSFSNQERFSNQNRSSHQVKPRLYQSLDEDDYLFGSEVALAYLSETALPLSSARSKRVVNEYVQLLSWDISEAESYWQHFLQKQLRPVIPILNLKAPYTKAYYVQEYMQFYKHYYQQLCDSTLYRDLRYPTADLVQDLQGKALALPPSIEHQARHQIFQDLTYLHVVHPYVCLGKFVKEEVSASANTSTKVNTEMDYVATEANGLEDGANNLTTEINDLTTTQAQQRFTSAFHLHDFLAYCKAKYAWQQQTTLSPLQEQIVQVAQRLHSLLASLYTWQTVNTYRFASTAIKKQVEQLTAYWQAIPTYALNLEHESVQLMQQTQEATSPAIAQIKLQCQVERQMPLAVVQQLVEYVADAFADQQEVKQVTEILRGGTINEQTKLDNEVLAANQRLLKQIVDLRHLQSLLSDGETSSDEVVNKSKVTNSNAAESEVTTSYACKSSANANAKTKTKAKTKLKFKPQPNQQQRWHKLYLWLDLSNQLALIRSPYTEKLVTLANRYLHNGFNHTYLHHSQQHMQQVCQVLQQWTYQAAKASSEYSLLGLVVNNTIPHSWELRLLAMQGIKVAPQKLAVHWWDLQLLQRANLTSLASPAYREFSDTAFKQYAYQTLDFTWENLEPVLALGKSIVWHPVNLGQQVLGINRQHLVESLLLKLFTDYGEEIVPLLLADLYQDLDLLPQKRILWQKSLALLYQGVCDLPLEQISIEEIITLSGSSQTRNQADNPSLGTKTTEIVTDPRLSELISVTECYLGKAKAQRERNIKPPKRTPGTNRQFMQQVMEVFSEQGDADLSEKIQATLEHLQKLTQVATPNHLLSPDLALIAPYSSLQFAKSLFKVQPSLYQALQSTLEQVNEGMVSHRVGDLISLTNTTWRQYQVNLTATQVLAALDPWTNSILDQAWYLTPEDLHSYLTKEKVLLEFMQVWYSFKLYLSSQLIGLELYNELADKSAAQVLGKACWLTANARLELAQYSPTRYSSFLEQQLEVTKLLKQASVTCLQAYSQVASTIQLSNYYQTQFQQTQSPQTKYQQPSKQQTTLPELMQIGKEELYISDHEGVQVSRLELMVKAYQDILATKFITTSKTSELILNNHGNNEINGINKSIYLQQNNDIDTLSSQVLEQAASKVTDQETEVTVDEVTELKQQAARVRTNLSQWQLSFTDLVSLAAEGVVLNPQVTAGKYLPQYTNQPIRSLTHLDPYSQTPPLALVDLRSLNKYPATHKVWQTPYVMLLDKRLNPHYPKENGKISLYDQGYNCGKLLELKKLFPKAQKLENKWLDFKYAKYCKFSCRQFVNAHYLRQNYLYAPDPAGQKLHVVTNDVDKLADVITKQGEHIWQLAALRDYDFLAYEQNEWQESSWLNFIRRYKQQVDEQSIALQQSTNHIIANTTTHTTEHNHVNNHVHSHSHCTVDEEQLESQVTLSNANQQATTTSKTSTPVVSKLGKFKAPCEQVSILAWWQIGQAINSITKHPLLSVTLQHDNAARKSFVGNSVKELSPSISMFWGGGGVSSDKANGCVSCSNYSYGGSNAVSKDIDENGNLKQELWQGLLYHLTKIMALPRFNLWLEAYLTNSREAWVAAQEELELEQQEHLQAKTTASKSTSSRDKESKSNKNSKNSKNCKNSALDLTALRESFNVEQVLNHREFSRQLMQVLPLLEKDIVQENELYSELDTELDSKLERGNFTKALQALHLWQKTELYAYLLPYVSDYLQLWQEEVKLTSELAELSFWQQLWLSFAWQRQVVLDCFKVAGVYELIPAANLKVITNIPIDKLNSSNSSLEDTSLPESTRSATDIVTVSSLDKCDYVLLNHASQLPVAMWWRGRELGSLEPSSLKLSSSKIFDLTSSVDCRVTSTVASQEPSRKELETQSLTLRQALLDYFLWQQRSTALRNQDHTLANLALRQRVQQRVQSYSLNQLHSQLCQSYYLSLVSQPVTLCKDFWQSQNWCLWLQHKATIRQVSSNRLLRYQPSVPSVFVTKDNAQAQSFNSYSVTQSDFNLVSNPKDRANGNAVNLNQTLPNLHLQNFPQNHLWQIWLEKEVGTVASMLPQSLTSFFAQKVIVVKGEKSKTATNEQFALDSAIHLHPADRKLFNTELMSLALWEATSDKRQSSIVDCEIEHKLSNLREVNNRNSRNVCELSNASLRSGYKSFPELGAYLALDWQWQYHLLQLHQSHKLLPEATIDNLYNNLTQVYGLHYGVDVTSSNVSGGDKSKVERWLRGKLGGDNSTQQGSSTNSPLSRAISLLISKDNVPTWQPLNNLASEKVASVDVTKSNTELRCSLDIEAQASSAQETKQQKSSLGGFAALWQKLTRKEALHKVTYDADVAVDKNELTAENDSASVEVTTIVIDDSDSGSVVKDSSFADDAGNVLANEEEVSTNNMNAISDDIDPFRSLSSRKVETRVVDRVLSFNQACAQAGVKAVYRSSYLSNNTSTSNPTQAVVNSSSVLHGNAVSSVTEEEKQHKEVSPQIKEETKSINLKDASFSNSVTKSDANTLSLQVVNPQGYITALAGQQTAVALKDAQELERLRLEILPAYMHEQMNASLTEVTPCYFSTLLTQKLQLSVALRNLPELLPETFYVTQVVNTQVNRNWQRAAITSYLRHKQDILAPDYLFTATTSTLPQALNYLPQGLELSEYEACQLAFSYLFTQACYTMQFGYMNKHHMPALGDSYIDPVQVKEIFWGGSFGEQAEASRELVAQWALTLTSSDQVLEAYTKNTSYSNEHVVDGSKKLSVNGGEKFRDDGNNYTDGTLSTTTLAVGVDMHFASYQVTHLDLHLAKQKPHLQINELITKCRMYYLYWSRLLPQLKNYSACLQGEISWHLMPSLQVEPLAKLYTTTYSVYHLDAKQEYLLAQLNQEQQAYLYYYIGLNLQQLQAQLQQRFS